MRRWLINTFGEEYLASGSGVLEVAGGKGELAFEFMNLSGINTTVFDPRPMELTRCVSTRRVQL
jgi:ubiquinone/menaquinone biosynthesis C-methylase UbiE